MQIDAFLLLLLLLLFLLLLLLSLLLLLLSFLIVTAIIVAAIVTLSIITTIYIFIFIFTLVLPTIVNSPTAHPPVFSLLFYGLSVSPGPSYICVEVPYSLHLCTSYPSLSSSI